MDENPYEPPKDLNSLPSATSSRKIKLISLATAIVLVIIGTLAWFFLSVPDYGQP